MSADHDTQHTPENDTKAFPLRSPEAHRQASAGTAQHAEVKGVEVSNDGMQAPSETQAFERPKSLNIATHVKELNGTRGRGAYHVRVKHDREWNEVIVRLTDGSCTRATNHIDLGHTRDDKAGAIDELYAAVKSFLAI